MTKLITYCSIFIFFIQIGFSAEEQVPNSLSALPSKPGPHIEKIKALGDNEWLNLGSPAPDEKWGKEGIARGRSWGGRALCYAPDLQGAFFCGTGVHGHIKSDGYYMDDLWLYDINAHKWICLYPGASKKTKLTVDEHGFERNEKGDFIPVSYLSHAYGSMTYDSDQKKLVILWSYCPWWTKAVPQRAEWLGIPEKDRGNPYRQGKLNAEAKHPIFWDVKAGKWARSFIDGPGPKSHGAAWSRTTEYIPFLKKTFCNGWLYDHETNKWEQIGKGGGGHNGCYDSKRKRIYSAHRDNISFFDLESKKWIPVKGEGQPEDFGSSNNGRFTFDTESGKIVWHKSDKEKGNIFTYDAEANKWEKPERTFPANVVVQYKCLHGFYSTDLNAHFYYLAGDSSNNNVSMLAYRYKKAQKENK